MKIRYKTGNALEADELCILHGCNAQGGMGSGIAKAIRANFPEAYIEYRKEYETNGLQLGSIVWAESNGKLIANGITQEFYGRDNKCYIDYNAINKVMEQVHHNASTEGFGVVMPLIGAGLGGGSWKKIAGIIEQNFTDVEPVVYILDGIIPIN